MIDKKGISRTYAITFFDNKKFSNELEKINKEIKKGNPIGKEFRKKGYSIRKNVIDVLIVTLSNKIKKEFKTKENFAKVRLSEFYANKGRKNPEIYGIVAEVYSPDFRPPILNATDISQINPLTEMFKKIGISKKEVWKRLGNDNDWSNLSEKHTKAKILSLSKIFKYHEKLKKLT
ncbi:MAG: hypothetical protein KKA65_00080 [Nanoarchaeota archaeon]|nr:hypothetical protein [Nanoarchaeota archaeon]